MFVLCIAAPITTYSEVYVSDKFGSIPPPISINVKAGQILPLPLRVAKLNAEIRISVNSTQSSFDDVKLLVCNTAAKDKYLSGLTASCQNRSFSSQTNFILNVKGGEEYWLVFDNKGSLFTSKQITMQTYVLVDIAEEKRKEISKGLEKGLDNIFRYIESDEFDLNIVPCGVSNAFSTRDGGHVTMCSELLSDVTQKNIPHAFTGVFMHELGHTFLNLWGSPNFANEKTADEFAVALMFISENFPSPEGTTDDEVSPEEVVRDLIKYFESISNLSRETQAAMLGDQHALSIQRVNNFKSILVTPKSFIKRWNSEIYPHLTVVALQSIVEMPHVGADIELAKDLLAQKKACGSVVLSKCRISSE